MKNAKRLVIAILSVVLALCATLVLSACDTGYTVTVAEYNHSYGSVVVSDPSSGDKYAKGETVTVTVTPTNGYEVGSFSVSGHSDATLTDNQYTFAVESDTTVSVIFRKIAQGTRYSIDTIFNAQMGSVTVSEPADGGNKYAHGESVTVTVKPIAKYKVADDGFKVTGHNDAQLVDGKYTFNITGDTDIRVTFQLENVPKMTEEKLEHLRGSILLEGYVDEIDFLYAETFTSDMRTLFDGVNNAVWLQEWYQGRLMYNVIYHDVDGKAAILQHDEKGKLASEKSKDDFVDFFNPFDWLTADDFEYIDYVDYGEWSIVDFDKAEVASTAITGYTGKIDSFRLYEKNGVITQIVIRASRISHPDYGMDYQDIYYFDISERGAEIAMPDEWFADYQLTPEHDELIAALEKAHDAESYTVHYFGHEEGYEDVVYNMFVTPDGIYEDNEGWEGGFIERADGGVWWFSYDTETETFDFENHALGGVYDISNLYAWFILNDAWDDFDISYSMLESKGNGVFELRYIDTVCENYYLPFAGAMAALFGTGSDQPRYFFYAIDFRITIQDGELYQVEFTYSIPGQITEHIVLTFGDFNNTTLPIEITDDAYYGLFDSEYIGAWMDEAGYTTVIITPDRLTINGEEIDGIVKVDDGYSFTYDNKQYTLSYRSSDQSLALKTGNVETILYSTASKWAAYIGVYVGVDRKGVAYTVIVSEDGIVVLYNGEAVASQAIGFGSFAGYDYLIFVANGVDYEFGEDENGLYLYSNGKTVINISLKRITPADCAWYNYVGLYRYYDMFAGSYEIIITPDAIYITIDGEQTKITDFKFDNTGFTFMFGGVSYCISNTSYRDDVNTIAFYPEANMSDNVELNRVTGSGSISFDKIFEGIWEDADGEWKIVITAHSLTINGEQIDSVEYLGYNIYDVYYNGLSCMLTYRNGKLYFTQGENDIFVELTKTGSVFDPSTSNWGPFVGTFEGTDNAGVNYQIVITTTTITVTIGNNTTEAVIVDYDKDFREFELTLDGEMYYLSYEQESAGIIYSVRFYSSDYKTVMVVLARV